MKKRKKIKLLCIIIIVMILPIIIHTTVTATVIDTARAFESIPETKDGLTEEEIEQIMENLPEEIIYRYDMETKTTTVVDIKDIKQRNSSQTVSSPSYYDINGGILKNSFSSMMNRSGYQFYMTPDVYVFPYSSVAKIKALKADGTLGQGTGFFVASDLLLTAAHCVFEEYSDTTFTNWRCIARYDSTIQDNGTLTDSEYDELFDRTGWKSITYSSYYSLLPSGWADEYDWCLCELEESLGNTYSWLGCTSYGNDSSLENLSIKAIGYPYIYGSFAGKIQHYSLGSLYDINSRDFHSNAKTYHGMSGGAIIQTSDNHVVGIVKGEEEDNADETCGVRITSNIINLINEHTGL